MRITTVIAGKALPRCSITYFQTIKQYAKRDVTQILRMMISTVLITVDQKYTLANLKKLPGQRLDYMGYATWYIMYLD